MMGIFDKKNTERRGKDIWEIDEGRRTIGSATKKTKNLDY